MCFELMFCHDPPAPTFCRTHHVAFCACCRGRAPAKTCFYATEHHSCTYLALQAAGSEITTVEGLADGDELSALQAAFLDEGGVQCGFCTPGMLVSAHALLRRNPDPSEEEIRLALSGNLCRCTGYQKIASAVMKAARATA